MTTTIDITAADAATALESGDILALVRGGVWMQVAASLLGGSVAGFAGAWNAETAYTAGQLLKYAGAIYAVTASFTSGSSFDPTNLTLVKAPTGVTATTLGTLPDDVTLEGDVYIAGATALPTGLTTNGSVIMTDGTVYFPNTQSNGGVLSVYTGA
ncbi:hypothetical protein J2D73_16810 [Acetobacter sacchari]|uniref:Uncharacterized protein n=1 Tax=Acetobacter sacchari TaxID=2661687 RepID=A0ABS3LZW7_9PROT|nr:hypothetical protein [Acetobacter sacchari]MBO1361448.1 hypothetical protein [Acetobacter sacchari]